MSKTEIKIQFFITLYMDALGQRDGLERLRSLDFNTNPNVPEAIALIDETYSRVSSTREGFYAFLNGLKDTGLRQKFKDCRDDFNDDFQRLLSADVFFEHLSDSVLIYSPLFSNGTTEANGVHLFHVMAATILIHTLALSEKIPFRGGIDIGVGALMPDSRYDGGVSLYGPVLADVVILEERVADWPRIVVGNSLETLLREKLLPNGVSFADISCSDFFLDYCTELLVTSKSIVMLDSFGEYSKAYFAENYSKMLSQAQRWADEEEAKHKTAENVKAKYTSLKEHLASK